MTITKEQLNEAELACLGFYGLHSSKPVNNVCLPVWKAGKEIHEKLNAKKTVDYSVLVKHKIDCVDGYSGKITTADEASHIESPRLNHWFSALNFDDVARVVNDLREAGFDVDFTSQFEDVTAFKINGVAEGYEW